MNISEHMVLIDVNGIPHTFTSKHVKVMLTIGWSTFLLAWLFNILNYKIHPSAVDFDLKRLKSKLFLYIFGRKILLYAGHRGMYKQIILCAYFSLLKQIISILQTLKTLKSRILMTMTSIMSPPQKR